ncbi:isoflavone reductase [Mycena floridula]|nr:isoflavone reductase [Mycena floridula]
MAERLYDSRARRNSSEKVAKLAFPWQYLDGSRMVAVAALQGQDALITTMDVRSTSGQSAKLIEAAAAADVLWVLLTECSSDPTETEMQRDAMIGPPKEADRKLIEKLRKSSWVGITCSFWYKYNHGGGLPSYGFDFTYRSVTFCTQKVNTTTWPQTALAIFCNKPLYILSFLLSQKDMFDSVLRVTGTKGEDWEIGYEAAEARYAAGMAAMKGGDEKATKAGHRNGFAKALYARVFYPDRCGNYEDRHGLHNDILGLPKEDLDVFTRTAVERAEGLMRVE